MNKLACLSLFLGQLLLASPQLRAQSASPPAPVTAAERREVVAGVARLVRQHYVFAEAADSIATQLQANEQRGAYNALTNPVELAARLTADLVAAGHDKHFHLFFDPAWVQDSRQVRTPRQYAKLLKRDLPTWQQENFGFKETKILEGNVGYLNLEKFRNSDFAGPTAAAAMQYLRHTNAVIIDLRTNDGGYVDMVQLMASYFLPPKPRLMERMYTRGRARPRLDRTRRRVPGPRRPGVDLYLLTSRGTFSAAESFAYFLKNQGRATLIGETTGGGANPIVRKAVAERFYLWVPNQRPVDPVTQTSWEGKGVEPDVACSAPDALNTAYLLALNKLKADNPAHQAAYQWIADGVQARLQPPRVAAGTLRSYTGTYGSWQLVWEDDRLFYQRAGVGKYPLVPMSDDTFLIEQAPYLRLKVVRQHGSAPELHRLFSDGSVRRDVRSE